MTVRRHSTSQNRDYTCVLVEASARLWDQLTGFGWILHRYYVVIESPACVISPLLQTLRCLNPALWYTHVRRANEMHTFFINDLIQLYCLRHVSNNQVFIFRKLYGIISCIYMSSLIDQTQPDIDQTAHINAWYNTINKLDIVGTVYHLVIYMQSNKIHKVF